MAECCFRLSPAGSAGDSFFGPQKLPGQSVALLSYVDPVSALFFAAVILHEAMMPVQILGAVLILGGAVLGERKDT